MKEFSERIEVKMNGNVPVWQGYFRGWTRMNDQLHAIVEKENGYVVEVYHIYVQFIHNRDVEFNYGSAH